MKEQPLNSVIGTGHAKSKRSFPKCIIAEDSASFIMFMASSYTILTHCKGVHCNKIRLTKISSLLNLSKLLWIILFTDSSFVTSAGKRSNYKYNTNTCKDRLGWLNHRIKPNDELLKCEHSVTFEWRLEFCWLLTWLKRVVVCVFKLCIWWEEYNIQRGKAYKTILPKMKNKGVFDPYFEGNMWSLPTYLPSCMKQPLLPSLLMPPSWQHNSAVRNSLSYLLRWCPLLTTQLSCMEQSLLPSPLMPPVDNTAQLYETASLTLSADAP